ncbi:MAG: methyltransferase domain-containing protein [Vicinamibacterales bacterium]
MTDAARDARERIDRVLAACGGGRVLVCAADPDAVVRAWRDRGVMADAVPPAALGVQPVRPHVLWMDIVPETADASIDPMLDTARALEPGALVLVCAGARDVWERRLIGRGWRKHPLYQQLVDYAALEAEAAPLLLVEPVPATDGPGARLEDLAAGRDLHMDMLREAGRRADAHVARYMWARRFVRPGDRVLDAACGLGYGSRILADGTLAESVLGLDVDASAVAYAQAHYADGRRRLRVEARDLATLGELEAGVFDVIVSFETVEHLADPERFLADCQRLLTPAGRFVCSVPNEWLDAQGVDPNPHHLHVFDRGRLEALVRRHFLLEHVSGQTAGGGMKLPSAPRALWNAAERDADAEWWLAVGMTPPFAAMADPVETRWQPGPPSEPPTLVAFDRDYEFPWLVRALVSMGLRTESPELLEHLGVRTLQIAGAGSADRGAALCVIAYRQVGRGGGLAPQTTAAIDRYCEGPAANPHVARWYISLRYVQGLGAMAAGDTQGAVRAFTACAESDPLVFSPLLATKSVSACWLLGWMTLQEGDEAAAAQWWRSGIRHAERALHRPWSELMADRDRPVLFGLREAAVVVDLASQCAAGLHLLPHAAERPGVVWQQLTAAMTERLAGQAQELARLTDAARTLQAASSEAWSAATAAEHDAWQRVQRAETEAWARVQAAETEGWRRAQEAEAAGWRRAQEAEAAGWRRAQRRRLRRGAASRPPRPRRGSGCTRPRRTRGPRSSASRRRRRPASWPPSATPSSCACSWCCRVRSATARRSRAAPSSSVRRRRPPGPRRAAIDARHGGLLRRQRSRALGPVDRGRRGRRSVHAPGSCARLHRRDLGVGTRGHRRTAHRARLPPGRPLRGCVVTRHGTPC